MDDELTLAIQQFDLAGYAITRGGNQEGRKGEWLLPCPRCGKQKLALNLNLRRWNCLTCAKYGPVGPTGYRAVIEGAGGVLQLIMWMENMAPGDAAKALIAEQKPQPNDGRIPDPKFPEQQRAPDLLPTGLPDNCLDVVWNLPYMNRRGITLDDARAFGLKWVPPDSGWLSNRLVFPVWHQGVCLYWQARACWDEHEHVPRPWVDRSGTLHKDEFRKTLNPSSERGGVHYLGSSDVLGNLELASRFPRVAIVEGPTSGIRTGPDAVWTFGRRMSPAQIGWLIRMGVRAVDLMWDGPSPGKSGRVGPGSLCACHGNPGCAWPAMYAMAPLLAAHFDVRLVFLPQAGPGDWSREQLNWFRHHGRPFSLGALQI